MNTSKICQLTVPYKRVIATHKELLDINYRFPIEPYCGDEVGGADKDFFTLEEGMIVFTGHHDYRESYSINILQPGKGTTCFICIKVEGEILLPIPLSAIESALAYVGKFVIATTNKDTLNEYLQDREAELWRKSHSHINAKAYIGEDGIEVVSFREKLPEDTYRYAITAAILAHELGYTKKIPLVIIPSRIDLSMPPRDYGFNIRKRAAELLMPYASIREKVLIGSGKPIDEIAKLYNVPPEIVPAHLYLMQQRYKDAQFCQDMRVISLSVPRDTGGDKPT